MKELDQFTVERLTELSTRENLPEVAALARIALTAKQADPIAEVRLGDYDDDGWHPDAAPHILIDGPDWANFPEGFKLYGSPVLNSPEIPDGWVPCSERLPDTDGNYWGWWSESKRQGPVWFIKSDVQAQFQSSEITHWMPLPAAPKPEK